MNTDTLIIGSGIAGLSIAIKLAQISPKHSITLICKNDTKQSNTIYAQGGVAAVIDKLDSFDNHIEDTLRAGHYLNDKNVVEVVVKSAPKRLSELIDWGARFDEQDSGELDLGMEGGHSINRIVHHKDSSGKEIHRTLMAKATSYPNVQILEHLFVLNLLLSKTNLEGCIGVKAIDFNSKKVVFIDAKTTVLATGGIGQVFKHSTNPLPSTGDGIAMAYRAGAKIRDMGYVQFHPTALFGNDNPAFLISEAVRGYGAYLLNERGERFMSAYDPRMELATRDVVSFAIASEMKKNQKGYVYIDCRHLPSTDFRTSFPSIYKKCMSLGINPSKDLIPVTPAAHYLCGGIEVNMKGESSIKNLYACGECARTGLHGANRLASNSLLEALVFADIIAKEIGTKPNQKNEFQSHQNQPNYHFISSPKLKTTTQIKELMSDFVGQHKSNESLRLAQVKIQELRKALEGEGDKNEISIEKIEASNLIDVAQLIIDDSIQILNRTKG